VSDVVLCMTSESYPILRAFGGFLSKLYVLYSTVNGGDTYPFIYIYIYIYTHKHTQVLLIMLFSSWTSTISDTVSRYQLPELPCGNMCMSTVALEYGSLRYNR
jgi:hypothetical protein